ncbi:hypothetical protein Aperf_G00000042885 [Anoplocephala perfoliata]
MESTLPHREFYVLRYPGIVNNHDRAIETLGGLQTLNKMFNSVTRRLRLSFRPEMLFAKPVYGDHRSTTSLIIRAKRLRNKITDEVKVVAEVVGIASRLYTFNGMVDFQYGPFEKISANFGGTNAGESLDQDKFRVFYDQLLVKEPTRVLDSHLQTPDIPLFLPPLLFTRLDQPTMYCFSSRFRMNEYVELENNSQQHPYHRKERKSFAMFVNFGDPVPASAHPCALQAVTNQGTQTRKLAHDVEKLFQRRPIWSKAALIHSLKWKRVRECTIKIILPAYAYYVPNGPWGRVWVRFGYNPCADSSSRIYQTVDYRVRLPRLQAMLCISGRRTRADDRDEIDLSGSEVEEIRDSSVVDASLAATHAGESPTVTHASLKSTSAFLFSKDSWPDARQILYQLIDIDVPEVVEMLAAPVTRETCDAVCGWMPNDYQKTIRAIMTRYLESWFDDPMTTARPRVTFNAYKKGLNDTRNCCDSIVEEGASVACEYTAAAINCRPNCISVQHFHNTGRPQMLAFGSSRAICLATTVNNDIRVFKTISGHLDVVNSVMWIDQFKGPIFTCFKSCLVSGSDDGDVKLWEVGSEEQKELISLKASSSVIGIHAVYTDDSETQVVLGAASKDQITLWTLKLHRNDDRDTTAEISSEVSIKYDLHSCLTLRLVSLTKDLLLLFAGMTTGQLEVRTLILGESLVPIAGKLKGDRDWLNCLDCIQMYSSNQSPVQGLHILTAAGLKDNQIRIWHLQFLEGKGPSSNELEGSHWKRLELPASFSNTHVLLNRLESVLSGHDDSVTGLAWSPVPWTPTSCPQLLSASADKSLIIWAPSRPLFSCDNLNSTSEGIWSERVKVGTFGGKSLGFLGCAWGNYNKEIYGHGYWGDLSTWRINGEPGITMTGHFNSVTGLSWCRDKDLIKSVTNNNGDEPAYPAYLLTSSRDSTVRLHGLFYADGSGGSPPARMWRELARPQMHGYEMNSVVSLDFIRYISAGDEKVARVFLATNSFVKQFLNEATINAYPGFRQLPLAAVQPELGLSNRPLVEEEEEELIERNSTSAQSLYPPTESVLAESTRWVEINKLYGHSYEVFSLSLNPEGTLLASACKATKEEFAQIFLWRTDNWQIHQTLRFHRLTVTQMRFNSSGNHLVSVSRDRMWALWKADDNAGDHEHHNFQIYKHSGHDTHSRIIWACAWSPDNQAFLTASRDKQIRAWDSVSGERIGSPWPLSEPITAFDVGLPISGSKAFFAAVGFESGGLELVALSLSDNTCTSLFKMPAHWSHMGLSVRCLALYQLDEEETLLATGGDDGIVRIFKINPVSLMK